MLNRTRPRRRLTNILLLPAAFLAVIVEDIVWGGARAVLRQTGRLPAVRALEARMARLPGWAALPLFLIPEAIGRLGELWAIVRLANGHTRSAVAIYVVVRLLAALLAVFVYQACEPALMRIRWFAWMIARVRQVREWAMDRLRPLNAAIRARFGRTPHSLATRFTAMRRRVAHLWWRLWRRA